VRVRLVPVDPNAAGTPSPAAPTTAEAGLVAGAPAVLGDIGHELIVVRLVLPFPATDALVADAQVALIAPGGAVIPPSDSVVSDGYVLLNRVQYKAH
jgi:hypothetical protein